jgi:hypothetical protein
MTFCVLDVFLPLSCRAGRPPQLRHSHGATHTKNKHSADSAWAKAKADDIRLVTGPVGVTLLGVRGGGAGARLGPRTRGGEEG